MLSEIEQNILHCDKCKRLREVTHFPMPHIYYNVNLNELSIFCIGRNPGLEHDYSNISEENFMEIYHDRWWNCKIGKYIRKRFTDSLVEQKVFFTNICKCSSPNNSQLKKSEKRKCFSFLEEQIKVVDPKCLVVFGSEPKEILAENAGNLKYFDFNGKRIPMFFMYHPSYFRYTSDKTLSTKQDALLHEISKEA